MPGLNDLLGMMYQELPGIGRPLLPTSRDVGDAMNAFGPAASPAVGMGKSLSAMLGQRGEVGQAKKALNPFAAFLNNLITKGVPLGSRSSLIPAIRHPQTGEIFEGSVGGAHPFQVVQDILTKRKAPVPGTLQFGYKMPNEGPFVPETIATFLQSRDGPQRLKGLLDKGISMDTILDMLKKDQYAGERVIGLGPIGRIKK